MTDQELEQLRRDRWCLAGRPVRTIEAARDFVERVGFCTVFAHKPALLLPTFIGAWSGSDENLPVAKQAFADPRAKDANELIARLVSERAAFETGVFGDSVFLVAASVLPYVYAIFGPKQPQQPPRSDEKLSPLAQAVWRALEQKGPADHDKLRDALGAELTDAALDRALHELWARFRVVPIAHAVDGSASWDLLHRWATHAVRQGTQLSHPSALSGLISKYLDAVFAAEVREVEDFFSYLVPRSKVRDALNALLAARELSFLNVGHRSLVQVTPPKTGDAGRKPQRERRETVAAGEKQPASGTVDAGEARSRSRPLREGRKRPA
jgi:hypothetical protein